MLPEAPEVIVIAYDEWQILNLLNFILSLHGFKTIPTVNGRAALAAVRSQRGKVALLLTNIEMRPMSGIALANRVKLEFPAIRVLFVSGCGVSRGELQRSYPGCRLVKKPFTPAAVLDAVLALLAPAHAHGS